MSGGIIQLAAVGVEDLYISNEPQITFFKIVYRRHTNFSIEEIPQSFIHPPDFGKKSTCILSKAGDLISNIFLVLTLPHIPQIYNIDNSIDDKTRFAWVRKIGYSIIKEINIEIGGKLIDRHYGEWLNIWSELSGKKDYELNHMIGNVDSLFNYSLDKHAYQLFIPLQFWFCKDVSRALPILCLQYNNVAINLELESFDRCSKISPTHSILMDNSICQFNTDEYIVQEVDDFKAVGQFAFFDESTKKLYYNRISKNLFKGTDIGNLTVDDDDYYPTVEKYAIKGLTSGYFASPYISNFNDPDVPDSYKYSFSYSYNKHSNIKISNCFLLVNYIYLDEDERNTFYKQSHEYLIDQLIYSGENVVNNVNSSIRVGLYNSTKFLVWTLQQNYLSELYNNDFFNYTNSYQYNDILYDHIIYDDSYTSSMLFNKSDNTTELLDVTFNYKNNPHVNPYFNHLQSGKSLIKNSTILLNYNKRMKDENYLYFHNIQAYNHFNYCPQNGINLFSFSIYPLDPNPSGSCNMSKISDIQLNIVCDDVVNINNPCKFKCWALTNNILYINAGLGGLVFVN